MAAAETHSASAGRAGAGTRPVIAGCTPPILVAVDFAVLSVAADGISRDLHLSPSTLAWAFSAYSLVFGSLLLGCGRLADRHGRRPTLLAGLAAFAAGGLVTATAGSAGLLVAGRCIQGGGAALMTPAAISVLTTATPAGAARRRALRRYGIAISAGFVIGTLLGGALTTAVGWRVAVLFTLAPAAVAAAAAIGLAERRHPVRQGSVGAAWIALPVLLTTVGVLAAGPGGVAAAVVGAPAAVMGLRRIASARPLRMAGGAGAIVTGTGATGTLLLTFQLQDARGFSALATGALFACFGLAALPGARIAGWLSANASPRVLLAAGLGTQGAGIVLAGLAAAAGGALAIGAAIAAFGTGHALGNIGATTVATESADDGGQGEAAGILSTAQYLGGALGPALASRTLGGGGAAFEVAMSVAGSLALAVAVILAAGRKAL